MKVYFTFTSQLLLPICEKMKLINLTNCLLAALIICPCCQIVDKYPALSYCVQPTLWHIPAHPKWWIDDNRDKPCPAFSPRARFFSHDPIRSELLPQCAKSIFQALSKNLFQPWLQEMALSSSERKLWSDYGLGWCVVRCRHKKRVGFQGPYSVLRVKRKSLGFLMNILK